MARKRRPLCGGAFHSILRSAVGTDRCCEIAISHVIILDERPVRFRSRVGGLTTACRRGPEVLFQEMMPTAISGKLTAESPGGRPLSELHSMVTQITAWLCCGLRP